MLKKHHGTGTILKLEEDLVQGKYSIFGSPNMKDLNQRNLKKGTYYIIDEDKEANEYLVGEIDYLRGGFYLLGKRDTYYVSMDVLDELPTVDKVPDSELEEVKKFLTSFKQ